MVYMTLFGWSGIHHSNSGLQITHHMYINGYFMLLYDLKRNRVASVGYTTHPVNGNILIELKFNKPLTEAITCLLYLVYYNSVHVDFSRNSTTVF